MIRKQDTAEPRFYRESGLAGDVARLTAPVIEDLGYRLVRVRVTGERGCTVQIMAENAEGRLTIDDCAMISRTVSPLMDVEDPVPGHYTLEVSSPGLDRPLVRGGDFERFAGETAKLELHEPIEGRRRFRGRIEGLQDEEARLIVELDGFDAPQVIGLKLDNIAEARLVYEPPVKGEKRTGN